MPKIQISHQAANKRFKNKVKQLVTKLRKSESHDKDEPASKVRLSIVWGINTDEGEFARLDRYKFPDVGNAKQRAQDYCKMVTWNLHGETPRWRGHASCFESTDVPNEIYKWALTYAQENVAEEERTKNMSEEEKEHEVRQAFKRIVNRLA